MVISDRHSSTEALQPPLPPPLLRLLHPRPILNHPLASLVYLFIPSFSHQPPSALPSSPLSQRSIQDFTNPTNDSFFCSMPPKGGRGGQNEGAIATAGKFCSFTGFLLLIYSIVHVSFFFLAPKGKGGPTSWEIFKSFFFSFL